MNLVSNKKYGIFCICSVTEIMNEKIKRFYILIVSFIRKTISKTRIKRYADIVSPCPVPFFHLKYFVAVPPFRTQDFWLVSNISIQFIKSFTKPKCLRTASKKEWLRSRTLFEYLLLPNNHQYLIADLHPWCWQLVFHFIW